MFYEWPIDKYYSVCYDVNLYFKDDNLDNKKAFQSRANRHMPTGLL